MNHSDTFWKESQSFFFKYYELCVVMRMLCGIIRALVFQQFCLIQEILLNEGDFSSSVANTSAIIKNVLTLDC